jgi:acyl-CoA synthetase (NDP forming)
MKELLNPKSVAIVGASSNPEKVGATILLNLLRNGFSGKIFPVNPKYEELFSLKCYKSIKSIKQNIDVVVIATPADTVPGIIKEAKNKCKYAIIISGGFGETGNVKAEKELKEHGKGMKIIGPNCLGVFSSKSMFDTLFFPYSKLERPQQGNVAIISQSGGIGSCLMGQAAKNNVGIHSFISYGNSYFLNESDFLDYYANEKDVKTIILYIEGTTDGKRFIKSLENACKKKPVIVLKAGKEGKAKEAAKTHTGAIAGSYISYKAVFKKAKAIEVSDMEEMFDTIKIIKNNNLPKGNNIGIITNGGGLGVMAADEAVKLGLNIAELSNETKEKLKKDMPQYVNITNPLDIVADANVERYEKAIKAFMEDKNIDMISINILMQPPSMNNGIIQKIITFREKPIAICIPGGNIEEQVRRSMLAHDIPTYAYPERAIRALHKLYEYSKMLNSDKY